MDKIISTHIIDYSQPTEGMDFDEALKKLFPQKYLKMATNYSKDHYKLLTENRNKLIEWLKKEGRDKYYTIEWL